MRVIMLAVLAAAFFWAFDAYEYEGHHSNEHGGKPPLTVNIIQIKCGVK